MSKPLYFSCSEGNGSKCLVSIFEYPFLDLKCSCLKEKRHCFVTCSKTISSTVNQPPHHLPEDECFKVKTLNVVALMQL